MSAAKVCVACLQGWNGTYYVKMPDTCPDCTNVEEVDGQQELPLDGLDVVNLADGGIVVIDAFEDEEN